MNLSGANAGGPRRKVRKRVGRGPSSGTGKTSGRGNKGQKARSGYSRRAGFEGGQMPLFRQLPKRGFDHGRFVVDVRPVNVARLAAVAKDGSVGPEEIRAAGIAGRDSRIKILGGGEVSGALVVRAHAFSVSARGKIESSGGRCEVLP